MWRAPIAYIAHCHFSAPLSVRATILCMLRVRLYARYTQQLLWINVTAHTECSAAHLNRKCGNKLRKKKKQRNETIRRQCNDTRTNGWQRITLLKSKMKECFFALRNGNIHFDVQINFVFIAFDFGDDSSHFCHIFFSLFFFFSYCLRCDTITPCVRCNLRCSLWTRACDTSHVTCWAIRKFCERDCITALIFHFEMYHKFKKLRRNGFGVVACSIALMKYLLIVVEIEFDIEFVRIRVVIVQHGQCFFRAHWIAFWLIMFVQSEHLILFVCWTTMRFELFLNLFIFFGENIRSIIVCVFFLKKRNNWDLDAHVSGKIETNELFGCGLFSLFLLKEKHVVLERKNWFDRKLLHTQECKTLHTVDKQQKKINMNLLNLNIFLLIFFRRFFYFFFFLNWILCFFHKEHAKH